MAKNKYEPMSEDQNNRLASAMAEAGSPEAAANVYAGAKTLVKAVSPMTPRTSALIKSLDEELESLRGSIKDCEKASEIIESALEAARA